MNIHAQTAKLDSSSLPLIIINTQNREIVDEPKINALMEIKYKGINQYNFLNDKANIYNGSIGIEIRGSSSAELPQKPYGIETRDSIGENLNVALFNMPKENDWILLANYNDKTFIRNTLAFKLFREIGHYAPRTEFCEVIVNQEYKGIYVFTEKIKQDKNRVDIADLKSHENTGDDLTGGYIFKTDYYSGENYWYSNFSPIGRSNVRINFVYEYPKSDDISTTQEAYLKQYIYEFESVLYGSNFTNTELGYRTYLDVNSFIDYMLINEISRNNDGFKKSRVYYKDKDSKGGLIKSGPVWDFDWAWKNIDECFIFRNTDGSGWAHEVNDCHPDVYSPEWITRLKQDSSFVNQYNKRYIELRESVFSNEYLFAYIDSVHALLNEAQERHYTRWPILGINVGTREVDEQPETFAGETMKIKKWIETRLNWLDNNPLTINNLTSPVDVTNSTLTIHDFKIFPNPANNLLNIHATSQIATVEIYDCAGRYLLKENLNVNATIINVDAYAKGLLVVRIILEDGTINTARILKN